MDIFDRGLRLPSDNNMTPDWQDVIIEVIYRCINREWEQWRINKDSMKNS